MKEEGRASGREVSEAGILKGGTLVSHFQGGAGVAGTYNPIGGGVGEVLSRAQLRAGAKHYYVINGRKGRIILRAILCFWLYLHPIHPE
jgi:hypothetical protein